ncbi:hypothetical protein D3C76_1575930 [compost metagenome]
MEVNGHIWHPLQQQSPDPDLAHTSMTLESPGALLHLNKVLGLYETIQQLLKFAVYLSIRRTQAEHRDECCRQHISEQEQQESCLRLFFASHSAFCP